MLSHDSGCWLINIDRCITRVLYLTATGHITLISGLVRLLIEKALLNNLT